MTPTPQALPALISLLGSVSDDALSWVTHSTLTIGGVAFASITVAHSEGQLETVGSTDPLALKVDALQYELLEGPCLDAAYGMALVHSGDVRTDARWPRYGERVGELGIRAQAALAIYDGPRTLGALNLYSTSPDALEPASLVAARRLADQAATAMKITRAGVTVRRSGA